MPASQPLRDAYNAAHAGLSKLVEREKAKFLAEFDAIAKDGSTFADLLINSLDNDQVVLAGVKQGQNIEAAKHALSMLSGRPGMNDLVAAGLLELYPPVVEVVAPPPPTAPEPAVPVPPVIVPEVFVSSPVESAPLSAFEDEKEEEKPAPKPTKPTVNRRR